MKQKNISTDIFNLNSELLRQHKQKSYQWINKVNLMSSCMHIQMSCWNYDVRTCYIRRSDAQHPAWHSSVGAISLGGMFICIPLCNAHLCTYPDIASVHDTLPLGHFARTLYDSLLKEVHDHTFWFQTNSDVFGFLDVEGFEVYFWKEVLVLSIMIGSRKIDKIIKAWRLSGA